jgi:hypothetical protein
MGGGSPEKLVMSPVLSERGWRLMIHDAGGLGGSPALFFPWPRVAGVSYGAVAERAEAEHCFGTSRQHRPKMSSARLARGPGQSEHPACSSFVFLICSGRGCLD